jgi:hypothetical protein
MCRGVVPSFDIVYYETINIELNTGLIYECRCDERLKDLTSHVYYESIKQEVKIRPMYECRCDERPKTKTEDFTLLTVVRGTGTPKDGD